MVQDSYAIGPVMGSSRGGCIAMSLHIQTGKQLDVFVEDGKLSLYDWKTGVTIHLRDPQGLLEVLKEAIEEIKLSKGEN